MLLAKDASMVKEALRLAELVQKCAILSGGFAKDAAPYCHSKLESHEINSTEEHRHVMVTTKPLSKAEWMEMSGATEMQVERIGQQIAQKPDPTQSIHDFVEDDKAYFSNGEIHN